MSYRFVAKAVERGDSYVIDTDVTVYQADRDTPFTRVIEKYPVHTVVYGHLHGAGLRAGFTGEWNGVRYLLASCDSLDFTLAEVKMAPANITEI